MDTFEIVFAVCSIALVVGQIVLGLVLTRVGSAEKRTERAADKLSDTDRLVAALEALMNERGARAGRVEERSTVHGETLAGLAQRVAAVERVSHDCDELKSEVAILKDWKARNSSKWDQAVTDIAAMQRDIKTLFEKSKALPGDVVTELERRFKLRAAVG